jgi:hypothetical protein
MKNKDLSQLMLETEQMCNRSLKRALILCVVIVVLYIISL